VVRYLNTAHCFHGRTLCGPARVRCCETVMLSRMPAPFGGPASADRYDLLGRSAVALPAQQTITLTAAQRPCHMGRRGAGSDVLQADLGQADPRTRASSSRSSIAGISVEELPSGDIAIEAVRCGAVRCDPDSSQRCARSHGPTTTHISRRTTTGDPRFWAKAVRAQLQALASAPSRLGVEFYTHRPILSGRYELMQKEKNRVARRRN
jgi:hypothetical protein